MSDQGAPGKVCINCNRDCSNRPRVKDRAGRYVCRECLNQMKATGQTLPPPPRAARPAAAPPTSAEPDVLAALVDDAVSRQPESCPHCGVPAQSGAVLCVHCGYNRETGKSIHTRVEKPKKEKGEKSERRFGGGGGGSDTGAVVAGAVSFVVLAAVFGFAFTSQEAAAGYLLLQGLFGLVVSITVLVFAFMEDVATGFLTLCVPFYILYFVYGKCESAYVKVLFSVHIIANIGAIYININQMTGPGIT